MRGFHFNHTKEQAMIEETPRQDGSSRLTNVFRESDGFSLLELMISLVILTVSILALLSLTITSIQANLQNDIRNAAIRLTNQTAEVLLAQPIASWLGELPIAAPEIRSARVEPLPIVRASEARIARARELYGSGRLRDALRLLDDIDIADPLRAEGDRLRADVQRALLATAVLTPPVPAGEAPR